LGAIGVIALSALTWAACRSDEADGDARVKWLRQQSVPIKTLDLRAPSDDLQPLMRVLAGKRGVGLGEATHGTKEFNLLRARIVRLLVEKMGFRVFVIEDTYGEAFAVDAYLRDGTGSAEKALATLSSDWVWGTQENAQMLRWAREYNVAHPDDPIVFYGADIAHDYRASLRALRAAADVGEMDILARLETALGELEAVFPQAKATGTIDYAAVAALKQKLGSVSAELRAALQSRQAELTGTLGVKGWKRLLRHVRAIEQFAANYDPLENGVASAEDFLAAQELLPMRPPSAATPETFRDEMMAENFVAILDIEGPASRGIYWAHNGHVCKRHVDNEPAAGAFIGQALAGAYYAMGFEFERGGFQAVSLESQMVEPFTVPPAPAGSAGALLAATRRPQLFLDLVGASASPEGAWLGSPVLIHAIAAAFHTSFPEEAYLVPTVLPTWCDGLAFVANTTRADPLPEIPNVAR
jgi:erythromycin esterase